MPYRIEIDVRRELVTTFYHGVMTPACAAGATQAYREHPDFQPHFRALVDLSGLDGADMDTGSAMDLGRRSPYAPGAVLAMVAPSDLAFGLARAFEVAVEGKGRVVRVFRQRGDAEAWLDQGKENP